MFIGSVWHLVSAIVIGPALVVLRRLPNRGGSKRVRILSNLLFWLLLNGLLAATQKIGIIGGVFHAETYPDDPPPPPPPPPPSSSFHLAASAASNKSAAPANSSLPGYSGEQKLSAEVRETRTSRAAELDSWSRQLARAQANFEPQEDSYASQTGDCDYSETLTASRKNAKATKAIRKSRAPASGPTQFGDEQTRDLGDDAPGGRFKRATSGDFKPRKRQSPLVVFLCWTLSVGIKTVST